MAIIKIKIKEFKGDVIPTGAYYKPPKIKILKLHLFLNIFKKKGLFAKLEYLFNQVLCPYPDQTKIGMWWYGVSGRISVFFHVRHCKQCREWLK